MAAKLFALLVVTAALAVPALALADDAPTPAAAACKAEYQQLGADAFKAKYGPSEPYGNCLAAHGQTGTPAPAPAPKPEPQPGPPATSPAALCTAEYQQLGVDAFKAKYGPTEPFGNCLSAKAGSIPATPPPAPPEAKPGDGKGKAGRELKAKAAAVALALCTAQGRALGKDAFQAKYGQGKDGLAACLAAALPQARSILAACTSAAGADALRQCVTAALKTAAAR